MARRTVKSWIDEARNNPVMRHPESDECMLADANGYFADSGEVIHLVSYLVGRLNDLHYDRYRVVKDGE